MGAPPEGWVQAHLPRWRAWALVAAYRKYAWTRLRWVPRPGYPSVGWVAPPCPSTALGVLSLPRDIWTFLSSLRRNNSFSILPEHGAVSA